MKVLVAGGAGYVGSHCVRRLVAGGHDVTVYDNLCAGHAKAVPDGTALVQADLADLTKLERTLAGGFDAVMHFAAFLDVGESVREPLKYYENNICATIGLLKLMEKHGVRRMVFSSTCATYGEPAKMPITEDMPQSPINPYGHTKLAIEWALRDSAVAWKLGSCALRYFNAAGAASDGSIGEDHSPEIHLIPIVLQVALEQRERVSIYGTDYPTPDGTCIRDYIHMEDLAEAHLLALEALEAGRFDAYNVGTGVGTSVREIIEAAREITGHPIPAVETARRPGDPPMLYADPTKIKTALGWEPKYTNIRDTIATAWRWHKSHPKGYRT
ncbi:MAG: UDP-glucose 4-epimerase GalE [FCB group bacterium]|jgi:UDP-glucose 4-epimerase|nr:UDP-glucose 4-epimerase GalE [FCB group bacterium]